MQYEANWRSVMAPDEVLEKEYVPTADALVKAGVWFFVIYIVVSIVLSYVWPSSGSEWLTGIVVTLIILWSWKVNGTFALTNKRLLFFQAGFFQKRLLTIPYSDISAFKKWKKQSSSFTFRNPQGKRYALTLVSNPDTLQQELAAKGVNLTP